MKKIFLSVVLSFCAVYTFAQYFDSYNCPVEQNGVLLKFPFTGGFDAPQFSDFDINGDGLKDLYVFDRSGAVSMFFIRNNENSEYPFDYSKYYNKFLPKNLEGFATLKDFNGDNIVDIFSSSSSLGAAGIMLFQGFLSNGELSFELRRMGRPEGNPEILWNKLPAGQVYNASTDIPSIIDVDLDGDLDVLTFDEAGSYVYFCKNDQIEKSLPSDTMDFKIEDYCFGKFLESGLSQAIILSDNEDLCANKLQENENDDDKSGPAHSGSTVMAFDPDLDNDYDLILGDLTYNGVVFLENGGSSEKAFITSVDTAFPSYDESVDMPVFHGAFSLDVDADGLSDVIVAPNSISSVQNTQNIWYYKNTGDPLEAFSLIKKSFLSDESLDFGSYTVPNFIDYNADGLMDIILGSGGEFDGISAKLRLILMENVGTEQSPAYKVMDQDYLDFSDFSNTSLNPAPCFGDLDSDGDIDMLIGDEAGKLYYFENTAGMGNDLQFAAPIYNWMGISSGQRIRPFLHDYNKDGLLDLIIGERNTNGIEDPNTSEFVTGNLNYYENQGSQTEAFFDPDVEALPNYPALGRIKVNFSVSTSAKGGASPHFFSTDSKDYVIVGSLSGRLSLYEISSTDPTIEAQLLDDRFGGLVEGAWSSAAVYDIDRDNVFEILIGNSRGGLSFFKSDLLTMGSSNDEPYIGNELQLYPNPTRGVINISCSDNSSFRSAELYDLNGKLVYSVEFGGDLNISHLREGMYLLKISTASNHYVFKKVLLIK